MFGFSPNRISRLVSAGSYALFCGLVVYSFTFVWGHGDVVRNRFTDAWWHIAAADEFARSGVFAGDPFFTDTPPFAQFGLTDWTVGTLARVTGWPVPKLFVCVTAANTFVFLSAAFVSGWLLRRKSFDGLVAVLGLSAVYGHHGVIGLGLPFALALSLLSLFLVALWRRGIACITAVEALLLGAGLGVLATVHVFVGVVGGIILMVTVGASFCQRGLSRSKRSQALRNALLMVVVSGVLAWRWVWLHVSLRSTLVHTNAHSTALGGVQTAGFWLLLGSWVSLGLLWCGFRGCGQRPKSWGRPLTPLLAMATVLLACSMPLINEGIAARTSSYMAGRIPFLLPYGIVMALAVGCARVRCHVTWGGVGACLAGAICIGMLLLPAWHFVRLQSYLGRTDDYAHHPYGYIETVLAENYRGQTLLSDPWTSYYARGMVGTYAITVPSGHASPAVDYEARDQLAREWIRGGPASLGTAVVHALLIEKRNGAMQTFCGQTPSQIREIWQRGGWHVAEESPDMVLMVPGIGSG